MRGTVYFPPLWGWLADIVKLDTPANARAAAHKLEREFNRSGRSRQLLILRAVNLAAIRARIGSQNKRLSEKERREYREIHGIYRRLYQKLRRKYKGVAS